MHDTLDPRPTPSAEPGARPGLLFDSASLNDYRAAMESAVATASQAMAAAERVFSGVAPQKLAPTFAGIDLDDGGQGLTAALAELGPLYLDHAVYFHHRRYVAHLNCPITTSSLAAEAVASALNTSMDTWDQSGGATFIEQTLIAWTATRAGLGERADGIFTSGGTQSNLMAMLLAREHCCAARHGPGWVQRHGLPPEASRFRIFASEVGHFSIRKAAALLGLGHEAVVPVSVDAGWRMDSDALAAAIDASRAAGECPIAVVATFGSTDFGSLDDVRATAAICRAHGLWLHVDAAYGGGLLVSPSRRHECRALSEADSVTVDYHKSFFQPVACSALIVADGRGLAHVTHHSDYLNPREAAEAGTPDQVNKSLQTTRRFDALKLWLTLRADGADAIGRAFDQTLSLARATYRLMLAEPRFELLHRPALGTIVFRFRPWMTVASERLDALNDAIRTELARRGEVMIAATRVYGRRYLKFTLLNPATGLDDMAEILALIVAAGERLAEGLHGQTPAGTCHSPVLAQPPQSTTAHGEGGRRHG
ncbi:aspartate aminotransferase family protein [Salinisphaera sp. T31B1]|uniref:pyridoxal phosphate-dependent decarboxylase family protein n=1 Tax=Salinisphaera sp. T31B1 TaxID=727963 RepID=UPI003341B71F